MLKGLLKNKEFLKIIKDSLNKTEILDIILFGSITREKESPNDIDLLIVYIPNAKNITKLSYEIRKKLEKISKKMHIIPLYYNRLFSPEFLARESFLSEGFSLRENKFIAQGLGYDNMILFNYSLKNLNKSQRMQFYYALNGRASNQGILVKSKSYKFSDRIILSPIENSESIKGFLDKWDIKFIQFPILISEKIIKYKIKNANN